MKRKTVREILTYCRWIEDAIRDYLRLTDETGDGQYAIFAAQLRAVKLDVISAMNALKQAERNALYYHYIRGQTWVWTANKCNYSERQIRNIANKGIDRLAKAFRENETLSDFAARYF